MHHGCHTEYDAHSNWVDLDSWACKDLRVYIRWGLFKHGWNGENGLGSSIHRSSQEVAFISKGGGSQTQNK